MPWLIKALLVAARSKRGRELLFAGALGAYELARSKRARQAYTTAWNAASDPARRQAAAGAVRTLAAKVKR